MELLREYASRNSEESFATLVSRHIDLVYSAALRQVANHHQAEEITQAVFVLLARKARSLKPRTILPGWLLRTARLTAANCLRTEIWRARREREAYMQSNPSDNPDTLWQQMVPVLNDVIDCLREKDRNAVVLRLNRIGPHLGRLERQVRKNRLQNLLRKSGTADLPQSGGIDEMHVTSDHRCEGGLRAVAGKFAEQILIGHHHRLPSISPPVGRIRHFVWRGRPLARWRSLWHPVCSGAWLSDTPGGGMKPRS